ncbi:hypothetical protein BJX70DRAFT_199859 [Aspergillus crustosus]
MSPETVSVEQDSLINTHVPMGSEGQDSAVDNSHEKATATQASQYADPASTSTGSPSPKSPCHSSQDDDQSGDTAISPDSHKSPKSQLSPKENDDPLSSRIPRGIGLKQAANSSAVKGVRVAPEPRSSIPVAIRRRSAEQLGPFLQVKQSESSPGGIRLVEKPRGPRPRPPVDAASPAVASPEKEIEENSEPVPLSSSSSSIGSWDFSDIDDLERPETVFTGEYRVRSLAVPGQQGAGPTLRIASTAERIIMGGAPKERSSSDDTSKASPSMMRYLSKLSPSTPKNTKSPKSTTPGSKSSQDSTQVTRNFCRPQISYDSIPKRDISGKEMSISRKPVNRPSLSSLFSPGSKSLQEDKPVVPRIPDQYFQEILSLDSKIKEEASTPEKALTEVEGTPLIAGSNMKPTPETAIKCSTMHPHPPRTSSLQALSDYPEDPDSTQDPAVMAGKSLKGAANLRRNVTFNDFVPLTPGTGRIIQGPDRSRLPESRSNLLLGGFRSIFKSRGALDKERIKKEESAILDTSNENEAPMKEQGSVEKSLAQTDSETSSKSKSKHTRLPSAVSWTKSSRNPKSVAESPTTPTPSLPRLLAPPKRISDANIPSFARPMKSTRTKAGVKGLVSITPDAHPRRAHVRTASTGSPQRRSAKRSPGRLLMLGAQRKANRSPVSVSGKTPTPTAVSGDYVPKNLDAFHSCLDTLCNRIGEATAPLGRDRHIRLALSLQQQLGNYQSIEKIASEAQALAKEKSLERNVAEEALNTTLAEVEAQLEED